MFNSSEIEETTTTATDSIFVGIVTRVAAVQRCSLVNFDLQHFGSISHTKHFQLTSATSYNCFSWIVTELSTEKECIGLLCQNRRTSFSWSHLNLVTTLFIFQSHSYNWSCPRLAPVRSRLSLRSIESPDILGPKTVAMEFPSLMSQILI